MRQFIRRHVMAIVLLLALLAIVTAVFCPVFTSLRGSHVSLCLTHLRSLGVAMQTYAADSDGCLPNALTWPADLRPYVKSQFFHCPNDRRRAERSYEMLQRWSYLRVSEAPSDRTILLYEVGKSGLEYRHNEGMYIGHADGHAKWYSQWRISPDAILRGIVPASQP